MGLVQLQTLVLRSSECVHKHQRQNKSYLFLVEMTGSPFDRRRVRSQRGSKSSARSFASPGNAAVLPRTSCDWHTMRRLSRHSPPGAWLLTLQKESFGSSSEQAMGTA